VYLARVVLYLNGRTRKPLPGHVKCLVREMHVAVMFMEMFVATVSLLIVLFACSNLLSPSAYFVLETLSGFPLISVLRIYTAIYQANLIWIHMD
jgi:hypothetical protein